VDELAEKTAAPARAIRRAVSDVLTSDRVGLYYEPDLEKCAVYGPFAPDQDLTLVKQAADRVVPARDQPLARHEASDGRWIKVGTSPTLRELGKYLNFFEGEYPGGIPNSPGPVQSMLTSGLVGAGLGYGAGWLGEQLLPESWKDNRLRRTLATLGGAAGATPGALWGASNVMTGKDFNDPTVLNPDQDQSSIGAAAEKQSSDQPLSRTWLLSMERAAMDFGARQRRACKWALDTFQTDPIQDPSNPAVDINSLGQTMWDVGADPETTGTTMGALHAARQMPGGKDSNYVTPGQMGQLAASMGTGYVSGALVGKALGTLTGMPEGPQNKLKQTGMYLGAVKSVVPKLFGG
jgi:hypothetical protein